MSDSADPSRFKAPMPHPPPYEDDGTNHDYWRRISISTISPRRPRISMTLGVMAIATEVRMHRSHCRSR